MGVTLFRCEPLTAWISPATCEQNAALAGVAKKAEPWTDQYAAGRRYLDCCPGCPGVVARSAMDGFEPRDLDLRRGDPTPAPRPRERSPAALGKFMAKTDTFTTAQCAELLHLTDQGAANAMRAARIKPTREGRLLRWPKAEVVELARARREGEKATRRPAPAEPVRRAAPKEVTRVEVEASPDAVHVPVERRGNGQASVESLDDLVQRLRAEREAFAARVAAIDEAISAIERAERLLGGAAS